jgi:hypothetical protein
MGRPIEVPLLFVGLYETTLVADWRYYGIVPAPNDRLELWSWKYTPDKETPVHKSFMTAPKDSAELLEPDGIRLGSNPDHMFLAEPNGGLMTMTWQGRRRELKRLEAPNFVVSPDPHKGYDLYLGAPRNLQSVS